MCFATTLSLCGVAIPLLANVAGFEATLTMPSPFVHQPFSVACLPLAGGGAIYSIVNAAAVTCTLRKCEDGEVNICGYPLAVPGGDVVGNQQSIQVPAGYLTGTAQQSPPSFTVSCIDADTPYYQIVNNADVSCNDFACQAADVPLCDTTVHVEGGAKLGDVFDVAMPAPYVADQFRVGCIGSNGNAPVYEVVDNSGVTCNRQ